MRWTCSEELRSSRRTRTWCPEALRLAQLLDHPVYDCVYLALALLREVPVVTADRRFVAAAARDPDVSLLVLPLEAASREGGGRTGPQ